MKHFMAPMVQLTHLLIIYKMIFLIAELLEFEKNGRLLFMQY